MGSPLVAPGNVLWSFVYIPSTGMRYAAFALLLLLVGPAAGQITAAEDHARMMQQLGIEALRPGANGMNPDAPNFANYDEARANPYPSLPDPLLTQGRVAVETPDQWWGMRRPEIVELFDREIYGRVPQDVPAVTWEVVDTRDTLIGGRQMEMRTLLGRVDNQRLPEMDVAIEAWLTLPDGVAEPVPVVVQFGWVGFRFPRPPNAGPTWQEQVASRGWGFAVLNPVSIQADNGAGLRAGIIGLVNEGQPREPDDWGALRAWAWGASRLLDFLESDPAADASRVAIQGHSRYGKAAVVAMAYDQRFAAAYPSSSGKGGLSLYRRNWGEQVENLAGSGEYHWMAGNFLKYAGPLTWDDLPIDTHQLLALCAPRPVLISSGDVGDAWVDARGMFMAGVHATPVYQLLGAEGLWTDDLPPVGTGLFEGELAYRQHAGGHTAGPNWPYFLDFVARYFE